MNEETLKVLKYFNLSEKEAQIYIASLKVGKGTVYEIAKEANIKRPTAYVLVDSLVAKGLITSYAEKNKTICSPISPKSLLETWRGRVEALEAVSIDLNSYYQKNNFKSSVMVFTGEEGVDAVYSELTPKDTKNEEILLFGSISALGEKFNHRIQIWKKVVKNKRNKIRELINSENGSTEYAQKMKTLNNPDYHIRITKNDIFGKCDNIIYGNKIAIFSLKEALFVIVIDSEQIVKTYKALFENIWRDSNEL